MTFSKMGDLTRILWKMCFVCLAVPCGRALAAPTDGQVCSASSSTPAVEIGDGQLQLPNDSRTEPTATIDSGAVIGIATILPSSSVTVNKFLGIQFAVSPPERFSPPVPVPKFTAPRKTQNFTSACIQQFASDYFRLVSAGTGYPGDSEDCLYLNVYTPADGCASKPVMFWIYGGHLQEGTAMQDIYDGSNFAASEDVVVVSANYRTNVFGFSSSPEIPIAKQNVGFLDQRLALDWVQRNIAAFGGDPAKVTLVGQSSGASSVDRLVLSPPKPLPFRGAITESGQASVGAGGSSGNLTSWKVLAKAFNCSETKSQLACVRGVDAVKIQALLNATNLPFPPVSDNITQLALPIDRTKVQSVPYLTGTNGQEGRLFLATSANVTNVTEILDANGLGFVNMIPGLAGYYPIPSTGISSAFEAASQLYTELVFQCPAAIVANQSVAAGFPTWRYFFNQSFPNINERAALATIGETNLDLEAIHAYEIPFVFGNSLGVVPTEQELALSKTIQTAWGSFIKSPDTTGPGWARYGSRIDGVNPKGVADLGLPKEEGVSMIEEGLIDARCVLYTDVYKTGTAPAF